VRPHTVLNGQTPADKAGMEVEGEDKWMTLIQDASRASNVDSKENASQT